MWKYLRKRYISVLLKKYEFRKIIFNRVFVLNFMIEIYMINDI